MENGLADARRDGRTWLAGLGSRARMGKGKEQKNPYSANHDKDWQPNPVDLYSAMSDDTICTFTIIDLAFWPKGKIVLLVLNCRDSLYL